MMLIRIPPYVFVRQYGPYTYVYDNIRKCDYLFSDSEIFFKWISREVLCVDDVAKHCFREVCNVDSNVFREDFNAFVDCLIGEGLVQKGEALEEFTDDCQITPFKEKLIESDGENFADTYGCFRTNVERILWDYFILNPVMMKLQIDITQVCSERCVHCYIPQNQSTFLPLSEIEKVIADFKNQGGLFLSISGGECMSHPNFEEIVEFARDNDLVVTILSNLTLCDTGRCEFLKKMGVDIKVSLYSMKSYIHEAITRTQGSFQRTRTALETLIRSGVRCRISCPIMKLNRGDYYEVLDYARGLGIEAQTDFIIIGESNGGKGNLACRLDIEEVQELLVNVYNKELITDKTYFDTSLKPELDDADWERSKICGVCINNICLGATGDYYPCAAFGGVVLGNCYVHTLDWVWKRSPVTMRIRNVTGKDFPKCLHCKNRRYCSVCMCRNLNETGDMFTPSQYFCDVARVNRKVIEDSMTARSMVGL